MNATGRRAVCVGLLAAAATAWAEPRVPEAFYGKWETFNASNGLPSSRVLCVLAADDGSVWAGTDRGLARLTDGQWTTLGKRDGLAHDGILSLAQDPDSGDVWIGTLGGLSRYSAGRIDTFTQLDSGLANNVVYGLTVHQGTVWAATASGTSRYDIAADRWTIYNETNTPMHENWCYSVTASGHMVYVAVWGGGLLEYNLLRDRWKDYRDPDGEMEIDLFRNDGLIHDVVASVSMDALGRVWVATYFGLSCYDGTRWQNFMQHDSPLASDFINFVTTEGTWAWLATDSGLNATDGSSWWTYAREAETGRGVVVWHPAEGTERRWYTETAIPHNFTLGIALRDETIWVATEQGLARGRLIRAPLASGPPPDSGE